MASERLEARTGADASRVSLEVEGAEELTLLADGASLVQFPGENSRFAWASLLETRRVAGVRATHAHPHATHEYHVRRQAMKCNQCGREGPGEYHTSSGEVILCRSCISGFFRHRTMALFVGMSLALILGGIGLTGLQGRPGLQIPVCITSGIVAIALWIYVLPLARTRRIGNTPFFAKRVAHATPAVETPLELAERRSSAAGRPGLFEAALTAESSGSLDTAARMYAQVIASEPNHVMAHVGLAAILNVQGQHDTAAALCRRAIQLDPNCGKAHGVMGAIHHSQNEPMLAVMEWMRGVELGDASSADMMRWIALAGR